MLKHDNQTLYLVREVKSTRDFLKLRTTEADKVRCGQKHSETLGVPFAVVVRADKVWEGEPCTFDKSTSRTSVFS